MIITDKIVIIFFFRTGSKIEKLPVNKWLRLVLHLNSVVHYHLDSYFRLQNIVEVALGFSSMLTIYIIHSHVELDG